MSLDNEKFFYILLFLIVFVLRVSSGPTAAACYYLLAIYSLFGSRQIIQALILSWICTLFGSAFAPDVPGGAVARYVLFVTAAGSAWFYKIKSKNYIFDQNIIILFGLGGGLVVHSVLVSHHIDISILKSISWLLVMWTIILAFGSLNSFQCDYLLDQVMCTVLLYLILGLPTLFMPSVGYYINGTGYQGFMNHPQAFGPAVALVGSWIMAKIIENKSSSWAMFLIAFMCVVLVVASEARTAGLGMIFGVAFSTILIGVSGNGKFSEKFQGMLNHRLHLVGLMCGFGLLFAGPFIFDYIVGYLLKRSDGGGALDVYDQSRGELIDAMIYNIKNNTFTGIGFGIASVPDLMAVDRDPYFGLPIGAAIEKGVFYLAVVEELGAFGAVFVFSWILYILHASFRGGIVPLSLVLTSLVFNLGENTFFSASGFGLFPMILMAWALDKSGKI